MLNELPLEEQYRHWHPDASPAEIATMVREAGSQRATGEQPEISLVPSRNGQADARLRSRLARLGQGIRRSFQEARDAYLLIPPAVAEAPARRRMERPELLDMGRLPEDHLARLGAEDLARLLNGIDQVADRLRLVAAFPDALSLKEQAYKQEGTTAQPMVRYRTSSARPGIGSVEQPRPLTPEEQERAERRRAYLENIPMSSARRKAPRTRLGYLLGGVRRLPGRLRERLSEAATGFGSSRIFHESTPRQRRGCAGLAAIAAVAIIGAAAYRGCDAPAQVEQGQGPAVAERIVVEPLRPGPSAEPGIAAGPDAWRYPAREAPTGKISFSPLSHVAGDTYRLTVRNGGEDLSLQLHDEARDVTITAPLEQVAGNQYEVRLPGKFTSGVGGGRGWIRVRAPDGRAASARGNLGVLADLYNPPSIEERLATAAVLPETAGSEAYLSGSPRGQEPGDIVSHGKSALARETRRMVVESYLQGPRTERVPELAERLGCSASTIYRDMNVVRHRQREMAERLA